MKIGPFFVMVYSIALLRTSRRKWLRLYVISLGSIGRLSARSVNATVCLNACNLNSSASWSAFKSHRNKVAKLIRKSYYIYVNEVIGNSISENPKRFWSYVKTSNTENVGIPTLIENDGLHCSDSSKANALNAHFQAQFQGSKLDFFLGGPSRNPVARPVKLKMAKYF